MSTQPPSSPAIPAWLALVGWILFCFAAPALAFALRPDDWYWALAKPAWNPPAWVFGPVWMALYTLMGLAAWRVWRSGGWGVQRLALALFVVQLAINALWSPLFFGRHRIDLALVDIVALWVVLVATIIAFRRADRLAAWLMAPYLAWVSFATFLNYTLWRLNP